MTDTPHLSLRTLMLSVLQTDDMNTLQLEELTLAAKRLLHPVPVPTVVGQRALHDDTLVSPLVQLANVGVASVEEFADTMCQLAIATDAIETHTAPQPFKDTLFSRSFVSETLGQQLHTHVVAKALRLVTGSMLLLPPLLLRADADAVYQHHPDLLVVCLRSGPVIPFVRHGKVADCRVTLQNLYGTTSCAYVSAASMTHLLQGRSHRDSPLMVALPTSTVRDHAFVSAPVRDELVPGLALVTLGALQPDLADDAE